MPGQRSASAVVPVFALAGWLKKGKESMPGRYSTHKLRFNRYFPAPPEPVPCRDGRNFLCLGKYNGPFWETRAAGKPAALGAECIAPAFLRLFARNALWLLPGDGLSHPEHGGLGRIQPSASFGCSVTLPSRGVDPRPTGSPPDEWAATAG